MRAMQRPAGYLQQKTQEPAAGSARPSTSVQRRWLAGGWEAPGKRLQMKAFPREGDPRRAPWLCDGSEHLRHRAAGNLERESSHLRPFQMQCSVGDDVSVTKM